MVTFSNRAKSVESDAKNASVCMNQAVADHDASNLKLDSTY